MRKLAPRLLLVAALLYGAAASNQCNRALFNEGCGPKDVSKEQCHALNCCYSTIKPNDTSSLPGPNCFYPINAEISSYAATKLSRGIDAVELAARTAAQKYTKSQCKWGLPVLAPGNRSGDGWGLGWDNLLEVEIIDVETADSMEGYDIVFYGDSISENWRGTSGGLHWKLWDGRLDTNFVASDMRAVFLAFFGYKYRAGIMAIAGDQIGHLWWRMLNGQLPRKPPKVAVVLIGTNDLYAVSECTQESEIELMASVKDIRSRFEAMLSDMRKAMPGTQIIVQGLLPRGADFAANKFTYPNNFTSAVAYLNAEYQKATMADPSLHYIYCGGGFLTSTGDGIDPTVMPDGLHPNADGLKLIAKCLKPLIEKLIPSNSTQPSASDMATLAYLIKGAGATDSKLTMDLGADTPGYVTAAAQASLQQRQATP